jgi:hypothetical protein
MDTQKEVIFRSVSQPAASSAAVTDVPRDDRAVLRRGARAADNVTSKM